MPNIHVELSGRASSDIDSIGQGSDQRRIARQLGQKLEAYLLYNAGDVRPIVGTNGWLRLRIGDYRILFRILTGDEVEILNRRGPPLMSGALVERIIHRSDLSRAVRRLLR